MRLEEFFKLEGAYDISGRGLIYVGRLLIDFGEDKLLGMPVSMNGVPMRISGIERHAVINPYRRGARIGLKLEFM